MPRDFLSKSVDWWHDYRATCIAVFIFACFYMFSGPSLQRILFNISTTTQRESKHNKVARESSIAPPKRAEIVPSNSAQVSHLETGKTSNGPKRIVGSAIKMKSGGDAGSATIKPLVFFFSLTDTTRRYALNDLRESLKAARSTHGYILEPEFFDIADIDHEDFFEREPRLEKSKITRFFYILLIPSYNIDTALDNFVALLQETHNDFRIDTGPLTSLAGYSVFGFGDSEGWPTPADGFCQQAFQVDKWMARLTGRKRAYPIGLGDIKKDAKAELESWVEGVGKAMAEIGETGHLGEGVLGSGDALESDEEEEVSEMSSTGGQRRGIAKALDDLEDIGGRKAQKSPLPVDFTTNNARTALKAMVPVASPTYNALTKQGYTIVGSHSGVKICRWTKSALRSRGSCYKFSFYGIRSHLCMETTPSLSCSNKCVFCWRHGTNPVGTTWRWTVDPPELIFAGAKEGHYKKIKMMRGVPGIVAERFQEAMKIRHCALSLVVEPIFYPHINELLSLLHGESISSFLVCNAQHPDQLAALKTVTQLYVSIDASNAESLRKIDRPLHRDYWQRFLRCLDILHDKRFHMRTVYRLTLVKGFNLDEEVEGYADLVARGLPCFVEIKGVTYCGTSTSKSAGLTMQNVPFYEEVVRFVEALNGALEKRGLEYGIAAEHAHSCCALIGSRRFLIKGKWHTLIDYEKYFDCLASGHPFGPEDYIGSPTPEWALWGRGGFDPRDQRVDRKGKPIEMPS